MDDRFRLTVSGEYILVQTFVHALQHWVMVSVFVFYREILFNTGNAIQSHVLGDFYGIRTPRSNHFAAWTNEMSFQIVFTFGGGFSKKPAEFVDVCLGKYVVAFYGYHALGWGLEKKNHTEYL